MYKTDLEALLRDRNIIRIKPQGYSMYPLFIPGRDEALIQEVPVSSLRRNDVILYRRDQSILVLHRIARITPTEKQTLGRDPGNPVKNQDALIPTVENDVIPAEGGDRNLLNQGLVPAGDEKGIHAVPLGLDPDDISIPKKRSRSVLYIKNPRCVVLDSL